MFCPKCATQNLDGASFCRSCGANISLIPQAMSGRIVTPPEVEVSRPGRVGRRRNKEASLDQAFKNIFMGIAFMLVSVALANSIGRGWWFWMLLPAFSMMGTGVAQFIRLKEKEKQQSLYKPLERPELVERTASPRTVASKGTGELMAPVPSVTEGTTRHLGAEVPTRYLDDKQ